MKHLFIVNPVAGKGKGHEVLVAKILEVATALNKDVQVYVTKGVNDGYFHVKDFLDGLSEASDVGIYSCGGDGTLNEVVNGVVNFRKTRNVSVGFVPTGTGNDFIRNFDNVDFANLEDQIRGNTLKVDLIKFQYHEGKDLAVRYCINMFNIGFECDVVYNTSIIKKKTFFHGSLAYLAGILVTLIKKKGANLDIEFDDGTRHEGKLLSASIGNGCYCGGGIKGAPKAKVNDGLIDVTMVEDIHRRTFVSLFPKYSKGTHLELSGIEKILTYKQCKNLIVRPKGERLRLCIDGEISETGPIEFSVDPLALDFIIPISAIR
jgi:YegS/Rv2252/BmrU family lipid kinase